MNDGILTAISVISTLCAIFFGYAAFSRNRKKDDEEGGAKSAVVLSELGYIKSGVEDIKRKQEKQEEEQKKQHLDIMTRLTAVEASAKQAHKRLDDLKKGG